MERIYGSDDRGSPEVRNPQHNTSSATGYPSTGVRDGAVVQAVALTRAPSQDQSQALTEDQVEALPQGRTALLDYDLRHWALATRCATRTRYGQHVVGWVFEQALENMPSDIDGWMLGVSVGSLDSTALPAADHQEDLQEQRFYELRDWEATTRAVVSDGRISKHAFYEALARTPSYIHTWVPGPVRREIPERGHAPAPDRRSFTPLPIRNATRSPTPSGRSHDTGAYATVSRRVSAPRLGPPRARVLESQADAFARSQRGRDNVLDHSRGANSDDNYAIETGHSRDQSASGRRRSRSPDRSQDRHLDHDRDRDHHRLHHRRDCHLNYDDRDKSSLTPRGESTHRRSPQPTASPPEFSLDVYVKQEDDSPHARDDDHNHDHPTPCPETKEGETVETTMDVDHQEVPGVTGAAAEISQLRGSGFAARFRTHLQLPDIQERKNADSICIRCWTKDLPCDHQSPCSECRREGEPCAYVVCPMTVCELGAKCPATHVLPGLSKDGRNKGTPMHLIALLSLDRSCIRSYDIGGIKAIHDETSSAQYIYTLMREQIKSATQQTKKFDDHVVRKLLRDSDRVPTLPKRALHTIASMITLLVEQQPKQPYREL